MPERLVLLAAQGDSSVDFCSSGIWAGIALQHRWLGSVRREALTEEGWARAFSSQSVEAVLACCHADEGRLVCRHQADGARTYLDPDRAYPPDPRAVSVTLLFGCATLDARESLRLDSLTRGAIYYKYRVVFYCLDDDLVRAAQRMLSYIGRICYEERQAARDMFDGLRAMYDEALSANDRRYVQLLRNSDARATVCRLYGMLIGLQLEGLEVIAE